LIGRSAVAPTLEGRVVVADITTVSVMTPGRWAQAERPETMRTNKSDERMANVTRQQQRWNTEMRAGWAPSSALIGVREEGIGEFYPGRISLSLSKVVLKGESS